jgi:hypothetical protein
MSAVLAYFQEVNSKGCSEKRAIEVYRKAAIVEMASRIASSPMTTVGSENFAVAMASVELAERILEIVDNIGDES